MAEKYFGKETVQKIKASSNEGSWWHHNCSEDVEAFILFRSYGTFNNYLSPYSTNILLLKEHFKSHRDWISVETNTQTNLKVP